MTEGSKSPCLLPLPALLSVPSLPSSILDLMCILPAPPAATRSYVAYVRIEERWYRMSDSIVTELKQEEVLSKTAFMLFYERTESEI